MAKVIHRIALNGEDIALQRDFMGFRVVHPIRNQDGSINWYNLLTGGHWIRLVTVIFIIIIILGAINEYWGHYTMLKECLNTTKLVISCGG
jgi:hypothetical protein